MSQQQFTDTYYGWKKGIVGKAVTIRAKPERGAKITQHPPLHTLLLQSVIVVMEGQSDITPNLTSLELIGF